MSNQPMCKMCRCIVVEYPKHVHVCVFCFEVTSRFHRFVKSAHGLRWAMAVIQQELQGLNTHEM